MTDSTWPGPARQGKGYPFEVMLPDNLAITGAVLPDQVKNLDWQARNAELICALLDETVSRRKIL